MIEIFAECGEIAIWKSIDDRIILLMTCQDLAYMFRCI